MNGKELKQLINGIPDDAEVFIYKQREGESNILEIKEVSEKLYHIETEPN